MICSNCGKVNENENNFCRYCGHDLKPSAADPHRTIFAGPQLSAQSSNTDLGYLIIAILTLINILIWMAWTFLFSAAWNGDNRLLYKGFRVISTLLAISQFIVMFIFAKRQAYKIVIAIIGGFVILYDLYYLILSFTARY